MIHSNYEDYDTEDYVKQIEHGLGLDNKVYPEYCREDSGDDGRNVNKPFALGYNKYRYLERTKGKYGCGYYSCKDNGRRIRPDYKSNSRDKQQNAREQHMSSN